MNNNSSLNNKIILHIVEKIYVVEKRKKNNHRFIIDSRTRSRPIPTDNLEKTREFVDSE